MAANGRSGWKADIAEEAIGKCLSLLAKANVMLSKETSSVFANELSLGEGILWSGRPDPLMSMQSKSGIALFAVVWLAISTISFEAATRRGELFGTLFALLFVGLGIWMLAAPLLEYRRARRTIVAITGQRLLIASSNGRSVQSIKLSGVRHVERIAKNGRLTLRIPTALVSDGDGGQKVDYTDLHGLRDGERAYRLLTQHVS